MPSKVDILQVEFVRDNGYRPDPKLFPNAVDLTPASVLSIDPNVSQHATQVAQLLNAGPAVGIIGKHQYIEAVTWMLGHTGPGVLCAGRTFPPAVATWDILNASFGATLLTADLLVKGKLQAERDNYVGICAPPDAGDPSGYVFPGALVSPNWLRVVSSTTGSEISSNDIPMVSEPVSWNSFAEPTSAQVVAAMISWSKDQFNGTFKAADIVATILASAVKVAGFAYPQVNYNAAMTMLHSLYSVPVAVVVTPTPSPVVNPIPPTPPIVPVPTPAGTAPSILRFDHGVSPSWTSPTTPTTFFIQTANAVSVTLTDPKGVTQDVTGKTSVAVFGKYTAGASWSLKASNPKGTTSKTEVAVHGCF